jgi:acetyl esterase/lipase
MTASASAPWTLLPYGPRPDQVAEVTVPPDAEGPLPLALLLHGGVWREPHDRVHVRPLAAALAATGVVVANVDYRRVDGAGGWPTTFADVALATDTVPDLIEASGLAIDRSAVVLVGHSAGGHLALWSTLRHLTAPDVPGYRVTPLPVAGVVPLAGVVALTSFYRTSPDGDTVARLMGGDPAAVPDRYRAADPALLGAPECRVVLVHGSEDEAVPVQTARDYAAAHDVVALVELAGTGHFEVIDPGSTAWPAVRAAVLLALGRRSAS